MDAPPTTDMATRVGPHLILIQGIIIMIRINPYPPNFNKILANSMDPPTGASTCAFGSHKCKEYMGSLTKNARIMNIDVIGNKVLTDIYILFVFMW